jgi:hypothetical protein
MSGRSASEVLIPGDLYVTNDDQLRVTVFNALASVIVTVRGRLRGSDGITRPFVEVITPTSDRVASSKIVRLSEGWLSNVLVVVSTGAPLTGQTFTRISIVRGEGTPALEVAVLAAGYVTAQQPIAWPGSPVLNSLDGAGVLRSIAGATPAAGAEVSEAVPTGARWEVLAFTFHWVTAVTVANRACSLVLDDGATVYFRNEDPAVTVASTTLDKTYSQGQSLIWNGAATVRHGNLPVSNRLIAGHRVRTSTAQIQAADQYSAVQYLVREWIEGA